MANNMLELQNKEEFSSLVDKVNLQIMNFKMQTHSNLAWGPQDYQDTLDEIERAGYTENNYALLKQLNKDLDRILTPSSGQKFLCSDPVEGRPPYASLIITTNPLPPANPWPFVGNEIGP